jgi:hypothetical protein
MTEQNFSKLLKILALYASFALEALLAQSPNYDEAADLSALTSLADERMHYVCITYALALLPDQNRICGKESKYHRWS